MRLSSYRYLFGTWCVRTDGLRTVVLCPRRVQGFSVLFNRSTIERRDTILKLHYRGVINSVECFLNKCREVWDPPCKLPHPLLSTELLNLQKSLEISDRMHSNTFDNRLTLRVQSPTHGRPNYGSKSPYRIQSTRVRTRSTPSQSALYKSATMKLSEAVCRYDRDRDPGDS